jgi:hypothetical protein
MPKVVRSLDEPTSGRAAAKMLEHGKPCRPASMIIVVHSLPKTVRFPDLRLLRELVIPLEERMCTVKVPAGITI